MFSFLISFDSSQNYDFYYKSRKLSILELRCFNSDSSYPIDHLSFDPQPVSVDLYVTNVSDF